MSNAEMLLRLVAGLVCWLAGTALVLSVVVERRGPLAAAVLLVAGTTAVAVYVAWPCVWGGGNRG
jgi:hypothetical protein